MRKSGLSWYKQERLIEHFVIGSAARCAADLVGIANTRIEALLNNHRFIE